MECKIKDTRYAAAVESMIGRGDLLCFTATNRNDWKKFLDVCQNTLNVKDITAKVAPQPLSHWQPPMPMGDLAGYGLQDYAIDFIDGPEPVLSMLCDSARLHRTGVSHDDISDAQYEQLKDSPIQSLEEFESAIRQSPGKLKAGGTAQGGIWHVALAGWLNYDQSQLRNAEAHYRRALELAQEAGDGPLIATVLNYRSYLLSTQDRTQDALAVLAEYDAIVEVLQR